MGVKEKYAKLILDELYKKGEISKKEYDTLYEEYTSDGLKLKLRPQSETTNSFSLSACIKEAALDIASVFDALNYTDDTITRHRKINEAVLNSIKLEVNKSYDKISEYEQRIKNGNRFVRYETFRDIAGIEKDKRLYKHPLAYFDKYIEAMKLRYIDSTNMLVSKSGAYLGKIKITRQHGEYLSAIKNNHNKLINAIDTDMSTYWHEVITVDSPIAIPYKDVKYGAVCELLVTFDLISEVNEITLTPFGEFPLQVVSISYSDSDEGEFLPIVYKENPNVDRRSKESINTMHYQLHDIKAKRIKVLLNQQHYVINHFVESSEDTKANGIFISDDKESLIRTIMKPVETAITNDNFNISYTNRSFPSNKLQYEYGLYNILMARNEFSKTSQVISTPSMMVRASTMILVTEEEHFFDKDIQTTSIEFELIGACVAGGSKPILPFQKNSVEWELLTPILDPEENKVTATLRFPAKISSIRLYKDNILVNNNYTVLNESEIEIADFNAQSNYCASYIPSNLLAAKEIKLEADGQVRVSAVLKQNSRSHTGITPILKSYILMAKEILLGIGEQNALSWLKIIPDEITIETQMNIPLVVTEIPVLMELIPNIPSINVVEGEYIELEDYSSSARGNE